MIKRIREFFTKKEPQFYQRRISERIKKHALLECFESPVEKGIPLKADLLDISETGCAIKVPKKLQRGTLLFIRTSNDQMQKKESFQFSCETVYSKEIDMKTFRVGTKYTKVDPFSTKAIQASLQ